MKGKVVFTVSDAAQILERWGGSGTVLPSAVVLDFNGVQPQLFTWDESSGVWFLSLFLFAFVFSIFFVFSSGLYVKFILLILILSRNAQLIINIEFLFVNINIDLAWIECRDS